MVYGPGSHPGGAGSLGGWGANSAYHFTWHEGPGGSLSSQRSLGPEPGREKRLGWQLVRRRVSRRPREGAQQESLEGEGLGVVVAQKEPETPLAPCSD